MHLFYQLIESLTENTLPPATIAGAASLMASATYAIIMDSKKKT